MPVFVLLSRRFSLMTISGHLKSIVSHKNTQCYKLYVYFNLYVYISRDFILPLAILMATPTSKKRVSSQKKITCGNTSFKGSSTTKPETKGGTKKHEQQTQRCDICVEAIEEAIGIIIQGKTPFF